MTQNWQGIEEGDRVLVTTDSGQYWGSIVAVRPVAETSVPYQVRYDEHPEELRWIGNADIIRLHRG